MKTVNNAHNNAHAGELVIKHCENPFAKRCSNCVKIYC